jgi:hypothetical protein
MRKSYVVIVLRFRFIAVSKFFDMIARSICPGTWLETDLTDTFVTLVDSI